MKTVRAPKMKLTTASWRMGCLVVWGLGVLCLLAVAVALFVVRPDPSQWLAALKPKSACDPAQLSIGGMTFRIQELARSEDGAIPFPADTGGTVYWIEGTTPHYVFALSPAIENLKLAASVKEGDAAKVTWTDCSSAVYSLRAVEVTSSHAPDLFNKPGTGLTVFVQANASGRGVALRSELVQAFAAPTAASAPTEVAVKPAEPVRTIQASPTPKCGEPKLSVGAMELTILTIAASPDGSIPFPADSEDIAYWVEGTSPEYVFAMSPAAKHLKLAASLKPGDGVKIAWGDCSSEVYAVRAIEATSSHTPDFFSNPGAGLTIFVQSDASGAGMAIRGERPETFIPITPELTDENTVLVDIEFLDTIPSADEKTVTIGMKITNRGAKSLTLSSADLSLTPENGNPIASISVDPILPLEIQPGEDVIVNVTFPRQITPSAVLRIFDITMDYFFP